jgi:hypothetical protein
LRQSLVRLVALIYRVDVDCVALRCSTSFSVALMQLLTYFHRAAMLLVPCLSLSPVLSGEAQLSDFNVSFFLVQFTAVFKVR